VNFQIERLGDIWEEVMFLCNLHWKEYQEQHILGFDAPMNPDKARYIEYNDMGYHIQFTARDEGLLVGHCGVYISESMHTGIKTCSEDTIYLRPEYRKGFNFSRMLKFMENHVKSLGVKEIHLTAKLTNKSGRLIESRGYTHVANEYLKVL
jgi:N-acetylglutamate synthase-like GNAT family acetyltransferase|tara:strand:- start:1806 stop:2258 length:453 start_codon:yes stop_codon:yes gene_type:complete